MVYIWISLRYYFHFEQQATDRVGTAWRIVKSKIKQIMFNPSKGK
jgi:hypothetical protein